MYVHTYICTYVYSIINLKSTKPSRPLAKGVDKRTKKKGKLFYMYVHTYEFFWAQDKRPNHKYGSNVYGNNKTHRCL